MMKDSVVIPRVAPLQGGGMVSIYIYKSASVKEKGLVALTARFPNG